MKRKRACKWLLTVLNTLVAILQVFCLVWFIRYRETGWALLASFNVALYIYLIYTDIIKKVK